MIYFLNILLITPVPGNQLTYFNNYFYEMINGLAGRSWVFDNLIDLPVESNLVKAALIGACFLYAWHQGADAAVNFRHRKILLITLIASVFVIASTKTLSKTVFLPRPFIQSQKTFHLEGDQLVESPRLNYRVPLDEENQSSFKALQRGEIIQNDLGSFPSDHAGFFVTLAVGILLVSRSAGLIAFLWTFFIILGSRIITGKHSPLDIAVGSSIGLGILLSFQFIFGNWGKKMIDPITNWTLNHSPLASAIVFIYLFEAVNTLEDIHHLLRVGKDILKHLIGG